MDMLVAVLVHFIAANPSKGLTSSDVHPGYEVVPSGVHALFTGAALKGEVSQ